MPVVHPVPEPAQIAGRGLEPFQERAKAVALAEPPRAPGLTAANRRVHPLPRPARIFS